MAASSCAWPSSKGQHGIARRGDAARARVEPAAICATLARTAFPVQCRCVRRWLAVEAPFGRWVAP